MTETMFGKSIFEVHLDFFSLLRFVFVLFMFEC